MTDYISREAFKAEIRRLSTHYLNEWDTLGVLAAADRIPAADVRPVVHGVWVAIPTDMNNATLFACSKCKHEIIVGADFDEPNYCPNCGSDMRPQPLTEDNK